MPGPGVAEPSSQPIWSCGSIGGLAGKSQGSRAPRRSRVSVKSASAIGPNRLSRAGAALQAFDQALRVWPARRITSLGVPKPENSAPGRLADFDHGAAAAGTVPGLQNWRFPCGPRRGCAGPYSQGEGPECPEKTPHRRRGGGRSTRATHCGFDAGRRSAPRSG